MNELTSLENWSLELRLPGSRLTGAWYPSIPIVYRRTVEMRVVSDIRSDRNVSALLM